MRPSQTPTVRRGTRPTDGHATEVTRARGTAATRALAERTAQAPAGEGPLVLERYRLGKRLGAGAFGTVWSARDERLERDVAVKIVPRERIIGGRFEREARAAARLSHPGIVTLYEAAIDDEGAYLISELVRGGTLSRALTAGRLSDREILRVGLALCDALDHAHADGVIHRDVKPSNILLPPRSGRNATAGPPAKLTDFGIAHVIGGDSLTRTGDVLGTAAYMSPEQAEGLTVGPESDLYSLSVVLYEALTGINPLHATAAAARARRLGAYLPPLRRARRDLPRELGAGIDRALRPKARERGEVAELSAALEASLELVGTERGVVASPWRTTVRLTDARNARAAAAEELEEETRRRLWAPSRDGAGGETDQPTRAVAPIPPELELDGTRLSLPRLARAGAAAGAAGIAVWTSSRGLLSGGPPPAAAALIAAIAVMLLPSIAYLTVAVLLCIGVAAAGNGGAALVLAGALIVPIALLPRRGVCWPLPAGAVGLGLLGLAGAWPAAAARLASSFWQRIVIGACGPLWLAVAGAIADRDLYVRLPHHSPQTLTWVTSLRGATHGVLRGIVSPQVLAAALVWGLAAAVLPWLVPGRGRAHELVLAVGWGVALALGTAAALSFGHHHRAPTPGTIIVGAVVGVALALGPALAEAWRRAAYAGRGEPGLP